jgi:hypothetical protein
MKWVITKAFAAPDPQFGPMQRELFEDPAVGQGTVALTAADDLPFRFRLINDDGVLVYGGRAETYGTDPLTWADGREGVTEIHYQQENGEWQSS